MNSFVIYLRAQSPFYKGKKINMNKKIYVLFIDFQCNIRQMMAVEGKRAFLLLLF